MPGLTYEQAGVSIDAGNELVRRIKKMVAASKKSNQAIGGFSGLFPLPKPLHQFYLSGCCDGVGTKLKIAFLLNRHDTVGIDLVAMNVNDLICAGAKPLFFLDYFACGKLEVGIAEKVIQGIVRGCEEADCTLLGGETAEMPGFYQAGEYDLGGFALGLVSRKDVLDGNGVRTGDIVLGLPSSGLHSNGYSLVRKVFSEAEIRGLGDEILAPTKIYVRPILKILESKLKNSVRAIAHITGGGWWENIPRAYPKNFQAEIKKGSWVIPEIFKKLQRKGQIEDREMFRTFNMGIGMIVLVDKSKADAVQKPLKESVILGEVKKGTGGVILK